MGTATVGAPLQRLVTKTSGAGQKTCVVCGAPARGECEACGRALCGEHSIKPLDDKTLFCFGTRCPTGPR